MKERIARLIRRKSLPYKLAPVKLPSTEAMPEKVSREINKAANYKLAQLAAENPVISKAIQDNITANLIAGSGFQ